MTDANIWVAFGALVLTVIGYAVSATVYMTRIELRSKDMVDSAKELILAVVERELSKEAKARHDMSNHFQVQVDSLERDYRSLFERMSTMVLKSDLAATETRIMVAIDKIEKRLEAGGRIVG